MVSARSSASVCGAASDRHPRSRAAGTHDREPGPDRRRPYRHAGALAWRQRRPVRRSRLPWSPRSASVGGWRRRRPRATTFSSRPSAFPTLASSSLPVVASFAWQHGGRSSPAIGADGRIYAVAGDALFGSRRRAPCYAGAADNPRRRDRVGAVSSGRNAARPTVTGLSQSGHGPCAGPWPEARLAITILLASGFEPRNPQGDRNR